MNLLIQIIIKNVFEQMYGFSSLINKSMKAFY